MYIVKALISKPNCSFQTQLRFLQMIQAKRGCSIGRSAIGKLNYRPCYIPVFYISLKAVRLVGIPNKEIRHSNGDIKSQTNSILAAPARQARTAGHTKAAAAAAAASNS